MCWQCAGGAVCGPSCVPGGGVIHMFTWRTPRVLVCAHSTQRMRWGPLMHGLSMRIFLSFGPGVWLAGEPRFELVIWPGLAFGSDFGSGQAE